VILPLHVTRLRGDTEYLETDLEVHYADNYDKVFEPLSIVRNFSYMITEFNRNKAAPYNAASAPNILVVVVYGMFHSVKDLCTRSVRDESRCPL
jgi:hypothetical protein